MCWSFETWRAASTTEPFVYPNRGLSTWQKGKHEQQSDFVLIEYLKVHEEVQELENVASSFPALGWETPLIGRVLQRHDDQGIEEPTEHEEVVDK